METREAEALALARRGDPEGFRALVEQFSRPVFRLAFRMTGNEADAEEVVQESFLRAYRALGRFDGRSKFSTWLFRIATNASLDTLRKRKRDDERREPVNPEAPHPTEALPGHDPAPDRLVLSGELRAKVGEAVSRLAAKERAAFVLRHFEGLSIEEIGSVLDIGTSAAKNNIFRAVQKLRKQLGPLYRPAGKS